MTEKSKYIILALSILQALISIAFVAISRYEAQRWEDEARATNYYKAQLDKCEVQPWTR